MIEECQECGVVLATSERHMLWHEKIQRQMRSTLELLQELGELTMKKESSTNGNA